MPDNNIVILRGHLASDPNLNTLPNGTSYLQLFLVVERGPGQMPRDPKGREAHQADVMRVVRYGRQAEVDYFYLREGATIVVFGWNQSRPYTERRGGREVRRMQLEVNAQLIVYEQGCNFERGDRHRTYRDEASSISGEESRRTEQTRVLKEQLLNIVKVEADIWNLNCPNPLPPPSYSSQSS